jgi:uncharacterized protein YkwD
MLPTIAGDHPKLDAMIRVSRRAPVVLVVALVLALVLAGSGKANRLLAPRKTCADPSIAKLPLNKVVPTAPARTPRVLAAMVCLHNYAHRRSGLPRFHVNRRLSRAAALKIRKMIACGEFSHTPCGINTATYEWQVGFTGTWWGENAAFLRDQGGYSGVRSTFNAWLNSPDHRYSILSEHYDQLGIAAAHVSSIGAYGFPGVIWVANFGSRH